MAKKSVIARNLKRERMIKRYAAKRAALKKARLNAKNGAEALEISQKLDRLPKNSSPDRFRNRCAITGRPRGNKRFGRYVVLSRNIFRKWASEGKMPGMHKSSW